MERRGGNIAEDTFLYWMDIERYMAEFKGGNLEHYDECEKVLRHLALREMNLAIEKVKSQGETIEIPSFWLKR